MNFTGKPAIYEYWQIATIKNTLNIHAVYNMCNLIHYFYLFKLS